MHIDKIKATLARRERAVLEKQALLTQLEQLGLSKSVTEVRNQLWHLKQNAAASAELLMFYTKHKAK